jgi:hypothetical protein
MTTVGSVVALYGPFLSSRIDVAFVRVNVVRHNFLAARCVRVDARRISESRTASGIITQTRRKASGRRRPPAESSLVETSVVASEVSVNRKLSTSRSLRKPWWETYAREARLLGNACVINGAGFAG